MFACLYTIGRAHAVLTGFQTTCLHRTCQVTSSNPRNSSVLTPVTPSHATPCAFLIAGLLPRKDLGKNPKSKQDSRWHLPKHSWTVNLPKPNVLVPGWRFAWVRWTNIHPQAGQPPFWISTKPSGLEQLWALMRQGGWDKLVQEEWHTQGKGWLTYLNQLWLVRKPCYVFLWLWKRTDFVECQLSTYHGLVREVWTHSRPLTPLIPCHLWGILL